MKEIDKIYRMCVMRQTLDHLKPLIYCPKLYNYDRLIWLRCMFETYRPYSVDAFETEIGFPLALSNLSPEVVTEIRAFERFSKGESTGDKFVCTQIAMRISYFIELVQVSELGFSHKRHNFDNPFVDFGLISEGCLKDDLMECDFEMFFDIMKCTSEVQRIIRFLYSSASDSVVWNVIKSEQQVQVNI